MDHNASALEVVLLLLPDIEPLGILALLALTALVWVIKNPLGRINKRMQDLTENHLHELPELVENSRRTVEVLQRIEVRLGENFGSIHAKLDRRPGGANDEGTS